MGRFRNLLSPFLKPNKYHVWFLCTVFAISLSAGIYSEYLSRKYNEVFLEYLWRFERIATFQVFEIHMAALELMRILPYDAQERSLPEIKADIAHYARPMSAYLSNVLTVNTLPERVFSGGDPLLVRERYRENLRQIRTYIDGLRWNLRQLETAETTGEARTVVSEIKGNVIEFRGTLRQFNSVYHQIFSMNYAILRKDVEDRHQFYQWIKLLSFALVIGSAIVAGLMFWGLRRSEIALQRAHDGLEATVRERTEELSHINDALRNEIQERIQAEDTLRANEERLRHAQKLEAVGQLTGGISHDFNNLLQVILTSLEVIDLRSNKDETLRPYIDNAIMAGRRGALLTQQLLAFSRSQTLSPTRVNALELVGGMVSIISRTLGEDIEIHTETDDELPPVRIDPTGLESAILNIALNARAAMPNGGKLTINVARRHVDAAARIPHPDLPEADGDYVEISLADTGTGMTKETLGRAFEPFFTTKEVGEGSGLGLSMVYGFVKQSDGAVSISSGIGVGTTVTLWFPVFDGPQESAFPIPETVGSEPGKGTVLVVEDDIHVRQSTVLLMSFLGYTVIEAEDGPAALRLLDDGPDIDLLFTDVVMPKGMNGFELARRATEGHPGLKALLTSGYSLAELAKSGFSANDFPLLGKPYSKSELTEALAAALGTSAAGGKA